MTSRRRFAAACLVGSLLGSVLFVWMLTAGRWQLFDAHPASDFYDAQAHSILSGHLDVPASVLGIEAFDSGGKAYMYQGPFPALLRLPAASLTHELDGRLAGLSMLVAFAVAAAAISALVWRVRLLVRGRDEITRAEAIATGAFVFACTGGSILVFEASQVSVYHESAMWGIALALAAFWALLRHLTEPTKWTLPITALLATACLMSRASVGAGVVAALGLVATRNAVRWWRQRDNGLRPVVTLLAACVLPMLCYCAVNEAKFGTLISVPWRQQQFSDVSTPRREFLDANRGTFFGLQFVPTTAVAYLRPDAFSIDKQFPWIGFRAGSIGRRDGYGDVVFDKIDATGSVPVSFPLLVLLGVIGVIAVARSTDRRRRLAALAFPLAGAAIAGATIFVFGFIAQRYLGDWLPFLVLSATVGFTVLVHSGTRRAGVVALVAVGVAATWITVAQGLWYQRVFASPNDEPATEQFYEWRGDLPVLPAGHAVTIDEGQQLPVRGTAGELFVLDDCAALYVADGGTTDELTHTNWKPVMRTPAAGEFDVDVRFPDGAGGSSDQLLVSGAHADNVLRVEYVDDHTIRIRYDGAGLSGGGPNIEISPGRTYHVRMSEDPNTDFSQVSLDGRVIFTGLYGAADPPHLGAFRGGIVDHSPSPAACQAIVDKLR